MLFILYLVLPSKRENEAKFPKEIPYIETSRIERSTFGPSLIGSPTLKSDGDMLQNSHVNRVIMMMMMMKEFFVRSKWKLRESKDLPPCQISLVPQRALSLRKGRKTAVLCRRKIFFYKNRSCIWNVVFRTQFRVFATYTCGSISSFVRFTIFDPKLPK